MRIIGITGAAGSGKSTLAYWLTQRARIRGDHAAVMAYADPLRDVVEAVFGERYETQEAKAAVDPYWDPLLRADHVMGPFPELGDHPVTGRRILQFVGTELFRNHVHPDIWVMVMRRRLEDAAKRGMRLVAIPDVRFDNEAQLVRDLGGSVIRLVRDDAPPACAGDHASERGVAEALIAATYHPASVEAIRALSGVLLGSSSAEVAGHG